LNYESKEGECLSPCALFYYMNDEVEFVGNYTEW